jgi:hypothetical protein
MVSLLRRSKPGLLFFLITTAGGSEGIYSDNYYPHALRAFVANIKMNNCR